MGIDYYGILQVARSCTSLEIKKAYRALALEFNPDRLSEPNAKEIFALIAEAYDVLSNPCTRAIFDQYGEEGLKRGVPGPQDYIQPYHYHGDPMKTYRDFFGTSSPFADLLDYLLKPPRPVFDTAEGKGFKKKQETIFHPLCLTLHEVFFGGVKKMKIQKLTYTDPLRNKTEIREKILTIPIKPGVRPGTQILFPEEGDEHPAQIPADIIFVTEDRKHDYFVREGNNLVTEAQITLQEALVGTTIVINTIDHRTIRVPITDIVSPGYEKTVENEGMPILERSNEKGNLVIRFNVQYPTYLPKSSKEMIERAFGLAKIGGGKGQHEMVNRMILADKIMRVDADEQLPPF